MGIHTGVYGDHSTDGHLEWGLETYFQQLRESEATPGPPENLGELSKLAAKVTNQEELDELTAQGVIFESANLALDSVSGAVEVGSEHRLHPPDAIRFTAANSGGVVRLHGHRRTAGNLFGYEYDLEIWPDGRIRGWYDQRDPVGGPRTEGEHNPFAHEDRTNPRVGAFLLAGGLAELAAAVDHKQTMRQFGETIIECAGDSSHPAFQSALHQAGLSERSRWFDEPEVG